MKVEYLKNLPVGTVVRPDIRDFLYFAVALRVAGTDSWSLTGKSKELSSADLYRMCPKWKAVVMIPDPDMWSEHK